MGTERLPYERRRGRKRRLAALYWTIVVVAFAALALPWALPHVSQSGARTPPALEEFLQSQGLADQLISFAVDHGNRFPNRLEEIVAGRLGRPLRLLQESKDGSTVYQVGDLRVVYLGAGQPLTDARETVIARVVSSVHSNMTYEIGSNGRKNNRDAASISTVARREAAPTVSRVNTSCVPVVSVMVIGAWCRAATE